jgi:hypothetical protein
MSKKPIKLVSLAAALTALSGAAALLPPAADAKANNPGKSDDATCPRKDVQPNVFIRVDQDLLGMIVKKGADGIVTADHYSHSSHASHSSHSSHYSGR